MKVVSNIFHISKGRSLAQMVFYLTTLFGVIEPLQATAYDQAHLGMSSNEWNSNTKNTESRRDCFNALEILSALHLEYKSVNLPERPLIDPMFDAYESAFRTHLASYAPRPVELNFRTNSNNQFIRENLFDAQMKLTAKLSEVEDARAGRHGNSSYIFQVTDRYFTIIEFVKQTLARLEQMRASDSEPMNQGSLLQTWLDMEVAFSLLDTSGELNSNIDDVYRAFWGEERREHRPYVAPMMQVKSAVWDPKVAFLPTKDSWRTYTLLFARTLPIHRVTVVTHPLMLNGKLQLPVDIFLSSFFIAEDAALADATSMTPMTLNYLDRSTGVSRDLSDELAVLAKSFNRIRFFEEFMPLIFKARNDPRHYRLMCEVLKWLVTEKGPYFRTANARVVTFDRYDFKAALENPATLNVLLRRLPTALAQADQLPLVSHPYPQGWDRDPTVTENEIRDAVMTLQEILSR